MNKLEKNVLLSAVMSIKWEQNIQIINIKEINKSVHLWAFVHYVSPHWIKNIKTYIKFLMLHKIKQFNLWCHLHSGILSLHRNKKKKKQLSCQPLTNGGILFNSIVLATYCYNITITPRITTGWSWRLRSCGFTAAALSTGWFLTELLLMNLNANFRRHSSRRC